ncbi:MAG: M48 family metalloprotease [Acidobacteria bacterium]|nr:M48 family metalloprotease [Acidobacteriota bacterium]
MTGLTIILLLTLPAILAQNRGNQRGEVTQLDFAGFCNYDGSKPKTREIYAFNSDREAEEVVDRIIKPTGLQRNFIIKASTVENAAASFDDAGNRTIFYNREFIRETERLTGTRWSAISVMSHEVGHHLQGHSLKLAILLQKIKELKMNEELERNKKSLPAEVSAQVQRKIAQLQSEIEQLLKDRRKEEMDADNFSGFNLCKLGATLEQATIAMKTMVPEEGSDTHPPRKDRLAAIEAGWANAGCRVGEPPPDPTLATQPSGEYSATFAHFHKTPLPWCLGRNCVPVQKDTVYGDGILTISASNKTISYREISKDLNPRHNFSVPCSAINEPKIRTKTWWSKQQRYDLGNLFFKVAREEYYLLGYRDTQGQPQQYDRYADEALRKIVEVCNIR